MLKLRNKNQTGGTSLKIIEANNYGQYQIQTERVN